MNFIMNGYKLTRLKHFINHWGSFAVYAFRLFHSVDRVAQICFPLSMDFGNWTHTSPIPTPPLCWYSAWFSLRHQNFLIRTVVNVDTQPHFTASFSMPISLKHTFPPPFLSFFLPKMQLKNKGQEATSIPSKFDNTIF